MPVRTSRARNGASCLNFDRIRSAAVAELRRLVPAWLPRGRREGDEWVRAQPHA
ncbi:hypothetical protein [Prosthecomicrobium sp. N25]|uniref:hypothetical protein n=1 Tax=Prosthecomicrobium sp. N25 TaxID=3129254 RepID=UPI003077F6A8